MSGIIHCIDNVIIPLTLTWSNEHLSRKTGENMLPQRIHYACNVYGTGSISDTMYLKDHVYKAMMYLCI